MKRSRLRLRWTGLWILVGPILACMWLAAINYANNLVYGILYLVGSLSFVSVFHGWRNLACLEVEHVRVHPSFAGEEAEVEIFLRNISTMTAYGLSFVRIEEGKSGACPPLLNLRGGKRGVCLKGHDARSIVALLPPAPRGLYSFKTLVVRSAYPFGLFWICFSVDVSTPYFVYPQARGHADWPPLRPGGEEGMPDSPSPGDDFAGLRTYVPGDSLRHVDWKSYARGRPLSVKQFSGGEGRELLLDAAEVAALPLEEALSQLTLWIVNAEKEEIPYALRWDRLHVPLGLGPAQARQALETLALAGTRKT